MTPTASSIAARRRAFRQLHASGCFLIPNPWDTGSARFLQGLGFKALATTSSGLAWSQGKPDGALSRETVLAHLRELVVATDLPVNADFESGFATDPQGVAESVRLAVETGVAGLSIEDATGDPAQPLHDIEVAVARLRAARSAIDKAGGDTLLVGRAENFFAGRPDLDDTLARLKAYAEAGADCLYAPGIRTREQIAAVVAAVAPKPVNLLVGSASELTLQDIAALGVRRVSVGGALARSAWGGFMRAARPLAEQGRFDGFADAAPGNELNAFFRGDPAQPAVPMRGAAPIEIWHQLVKQRNAQGLDALLADEAVFYSPVVHRPQVGKAITKKYLAAAFQVFFNPSFRYVRELTGDRDAVLEFEVELDGIAVNGVDMIKWNDAGQITEFKVMLRPLKAVNLIHQKMAAMLESG